MHTWCTPQCTFGAHLVNRYPDALLVHTWCTPGEQLTLLSPFYISISIPQSLSILSLSPYQSLYLFTPISTSIPLFIAHTRCAPGVHWGVHQECIGIPVHQVCTKCALGCTPGVHQVCSATFCRNGHSQQL